MSISNKFEYTGIRPAPGQAISIEEPSKVIFRIFLKDNSDIDNVERNIKDVINNSFKNKPTFILQGDDENPIFKIIIDYSDSNEKLRTADMDHEFIAFIDKTQSILSCEYLILIGMQ